MIRSVTARGLGRLLLELGFNPVTIRKEAEKENRPCALSTKYWEFLFGERTQHPVMGISWTVAVCGL